MRSIGPDSFLMLRSAPLKATQAIDSVHNSDRQVPPSPVAKIASCRRCSTAHWPPSRSPKDRGSSRSASRGVRISLGGDPAAPLPLRRLGLRVVYEDGRGILRDVLTQCTQQGFTIARVAPAATRGADGVAQRSAGGSRRLGDRSQRRPGVAPARCIRCHAGTHRGNPTKGPNHVPARAVRARAEPLGRPPIAPTLDRDVDEARRTLERFAETSVDYDDVVAVLEREGVQKFADSFRKLLDGVAAKRNQLVAS